MLDCKDAKYLYVLLQSYVSRAKLASEKWKQEAKDYAEALTENEKRQIQEYYQKKKEEHQKRQKRLEVSGYTKFP